MIFNITDFGEKDLFLCTESSIFPMQELGITAIVIENKHNEGLHHRYEPVFFVRIHSNEDRNFLKLALGYTDITLGDIYGRDTIIRYTEKA